MYFLELQKLGPQMGILYIQLASFPTHYLVLVITEQDFRYALISAQVLPNTPITEMIFGDIGWIDVSRIHGDELVMNHRPGAAGPGPETASGDVGTSKGSSRSVFRLPATRVCVDQCRFRLETQVLRELYAYCW
jgi:mediator of RNA polymerase II transcription subunit 14